MVATAVLMILLPNGSPRYIYPLIVVPCLLLGRALTVEDGSSTPDWLASIWRRFNLLLLTIVSLGVAAVPFFVRGDRGASLLDMPGGSSGGGHLVIRCRKQHPDSVPHRPSRAVAWPLRRFSAGPSRRLP